MTDDLVKQLRWLGDHASFEPHMHHTAANRIEKLEAALAHIYAWYPVSVSHPAQTIEDIREFARKALEDGQ
jgi:hypothetical protein